MAAINKRRRELPQFGRPSVRATHFFVSKFIFIFRRIAFSELRFNDRRAKKFASFSPKFLVLTTRAVLRTRPSVTTTCGRLR
jgi:hypothetical protein